MMASENKERLFSKQSLFQASAVSFATSALSRLLSFVREVLIAKFFGATAVMDAFLVAQIIPTMIGTSWGTSLSSALLPVYSRTTLNQSKEKARELATSASLISLAISIGASLLTLFFAPLIVKTFAPNLSLAASSSAVQLTRILTPLITGLVFFYLLSAIYNASHHFLIPSFSQLIENGVVIVALLLFTTSLGIGGLAFAWALSMCLIVVCLLIPLVRASEFSTHFRFLSPEMVSILKMSFYLLLTYFCFQSHFIIERYFASGLAEGSIACLGYARRLIEMPLALIAAALANAAFPTLSQYSTHKNDEGMRKLVIRLNGQLIYIFMPLTFFLLMERAQIVNLVFHRGAFDLVAASRTSDALLFYGVGLVPMAGCVLLNKCFNSIMDTKTPLQLGCVGIAINIISNLLLVHRLGIKGVALAQSIMHFFNWASLSFFLERKVGQGLTGKILRVSFISSLCSGLGLFLLAHLKQETFFNLIINLAAFSVLYFLATAFTLREEFLLTFQSTWRLINPYRLKFIGKS